MSHTCRLEGVPLTAHAPIRWARQGGIGPFVTTILTSLRRAEEVYKRSAGRPISLEIDGTIFSNLWVTGLMAGDGPDTRSIIVADCRWVLPRLWVTFDANLQRQSVERRIVGPRLETAVQVADTAYAPHSLRNRAPYTAQDVLPTVCNMISALSKEAGVPIEFTLPPTVPTIEVVNFSIDGPADQALAQLFTLLPGLSCEPAAEGSLRVYFESGLAEREQVNKAFIHAENNQYPHLMDRERFRPKQMFVLFEKQIELLFRYDEQLDLSGRTIDAEEPGYDLVNVVQVKEPGLRVKGVEVGYGSWISILDYVVALADQPRPAAAQPSECIVSMAMLRRHFCSGFARIRQVYSNGGIPDPLWAARFDTLLTHFRQTFAISPYWYERLLGIEPARVAVYDPVRNVRAPSEVYCPYILKPTWRTLDPVNTGSTAPWVSVHDEQFSGTVTDSNPAPFSVAMEDQDAMIFRIVPRQELSRMSDEVFPGVPLVETKVDAPFWINNIGTAGLEPAMWEHLALSPVFRLGVVLTATCAGQNDADSRYHVEIVTPDEAQTVLTSALVGNCTGPPIAVKVDPGMFQARAAWVDGLRPEIEAAANGDNIAFDAQLTPTMLREVAVAAAARVYETLCDRLSGERVRVVFRPEMQPAGALNQVMHELAPDGTLSTIFSFAQGVEPRDMMTFLPSGTRRILQRAASQVRAR